MSKEPNRLLKKRTFHRPRKVFLLQGNRLWRFLLNHKTFRSYRVSNQLSLDKHNLKRHRPHSLSLLPLLVVRGDMFLDSSRKTLKSTEIENGRKLPIST